MNLSTVKWAQWDKTQSRELLVCSYVCASHCAQFLHTILHRTDLIVFPLTLQTITTAPMMSIWGKGGRRRTSCCISDWKTSATCCITTLTNAIQQQQQQQLHHYITITVRHTGSAATWCNNVAESYKREQCFTHYWVYKADIKNCDMHIHQVELHQAQVITVIEWMNTVTLFLQCPVNVGWPTKSNWPVKSWSTNPKCCRSVTQQMKNSCNTNTMTSVQSRLNTPTFPIIPTPKWWPLYTYYSYKIESV